MSLMFLINVIVLSVVVAYFAYRLGYNHWVFLIISLLFSPIIGSLLLALWDYYKTFIKGRA
ncbi:MAG: hypothetical protein ABGX25_02235 [Nautiliaceae bacterium]